MYSLFKQEKECGRGQEIPLLTSLSPDLSPNIPPPTCLTILPRPFVPPPENGQKILPQKSFHEPFQNYVQVRNRIFNEDSTAEISSIKSFIPTKSFNKLLLFRNSARIKIKAQKMISSIKNCPSRTIVLSPMSLLRVNPSLLFSVTLLLCKFALNKLFKFHSHN